MALLNPPDILPEAMRFILRVLVASPSRACNQAALLDLVAPQGLAEATKSLRGSSDADVDLEDGPEDLSIAGTQIAKSSLAALRSLGFVTVSRDEVTAGELAAPWSKVDDLSAAAFSRAFRRAILDAANGVSEADVSDLLGAVALIMAAPEPWRPFDSFDDSTERRFDEYQVSVLGAKQEAWSVANKERWLSLKRIAPYVGFLAPVATRGGRGGRTGTGLLADCSAALATEIADLEAASYGVEEFVAACSDALPFLDGGSSSTSNLNGTGELSGGFSLTLLHLEAMGKVKLELKSDAATLMLVTGADAADRRPVSHVQWVGNLTGKRRARV